MSRANKVIVFGLGGLMVLMAAWWIGAAMAEPAGEFEGLRIPPLPPGLEVRESFLLDDRPESYYAVTRLAHRRGEVIWLEKLLHHDKDRQAHWQVTSAVMGPRPREDQAYFLGTCMLHGEHERALIALADLENVEIVTAIKQAWRVNLKRTQIEPISTEGVSCYREGWGHE